jgi:TolB-like protein
LGIGAEEDYFAYAMTDALTTELSKIRALRVTSLTSAMRFKDSRKSLPEIARELGVDAVVEGTVAREGNQVRITVQLIEAATDRHLMAESYQRDLQGVLALQGEVARAIALRVRAQLSSPERTMLAATRPAIRRPSRCFCEAGSTWQNGARTKGAAARTISGRPSKPIPVSLRRMPH